MTRATADAFGEINAMFQGALASEAPWQVPACSLLPSLCCMHCGAVPVRRMMRLHLSQVPGAAFGTPSLVVPWQGFSEEQTHKIMSVMQQQQQGGEPTATLSTQAAMDALNAMLCSRPAPPGLASPPVRLAVCLSCDRYMCDWLCTSLLPRVPARCAAARQSASSLC